MAETLEAGAPAVKKPPARPQRHLRNYLLNLRYQLRFTLTIVAIAAVLTAGLGTWIIHQVRETSRLIEVRAMDPDDTLAQQLVEQMRRQDMWIMVILIAFGLVFCVMIAGYGIVLTHKVAGPLYKITMYLDHLRDGRLDQVYNLRKGDQLVDFFQHFKAAHEALRKRTEEDLALLDRAIEALGPGAVADELKAARQKKTDSLT